MAPSTPSTPVARRSDSLPAAKLASSPDPQIETLYTLPFAKIVSFTSSSSGRQSTLINGSSVVTDDTDTLSWTSRFERTIAVGPLRIYRAPGSVAFLNCANALKPILPKSQAWCVDGNSKFVLQIRPPQYWRVEVPGDSSDDKLRIEELKQVLAQILKFELTPCPFKRGFTVELPPQTPIKLKPWKPVLKQSEDFKPASPENIYMSGAHGSPTPISPRTSVGSQISGFPPFESHQLHADSPTERMESVSSLILWAEENIHFNGRETQTLPHPLEEHESTLETPLSHLSLVGSSPPRFISRGTSFGDDSDEFSDATDDTELTPKGPRFQRTFEPLTTELDQDGRPQALQTGRSETAPPVLSLVMSPPSKKRAKSPLRCSTTVESNPDFSSSVDSFHSVQSWHSPLAPPSPPASNPSSPSKPTYPYPHDNIILPKRPLRTRDDSELVVALDTPRSWNMFSSVTKSKITSPSPAKGPASTSDKGVGPDGENSEAVLPPTIRPTFRHRATTSSNSRRRALSPLPPAVNLFSPPRRRPRGLQAARRLPSVLIQKTLEILLSPPSYLFHLMLSIASKIAAGEWRGVLSAYGEAVDWDFEDEYAGESWHQDDDEISLSSSRNNVKVSSNSSSGVGGSWEVD